MSKIGLETYYIIRLLALLFKLNFKQFTNG
jgi:hypothetical protein